LSAHIDARNFIGTDLQRSCEKSPYSLAIEQRFKVLPAVYYSENTDVCPFDAI